MISDTDCERIANSAETWQDVIRAAYVMGATGYQDTHRICSRCGQVRHVSAFRVTTTGKLIKACMKCEASVRRWNANRLAKGVPEPAKAQVTVADSEGDRGGRGSSEPSGSRGSSAAPVLDRD